MFSFVKFFFILIIFLFFSSCHEKDYDIIKDFILKEEQTENLKKTDTIEQKKSKQANKEKQNKLADNLEIEDKQVNSLGKKISPQKKIISVDDNEEDKKLKVNKNTSRLLEALENQKEKIAESQRQINEKE